MNGHTLFVLSSNTISIAIVLLNLCALFLCFSLLCSAGDTLRPGENITGNGTSLVSATKKFELGFFSPGGTGTYLGIWYAGSKPETQTVVWVGNRDNPIDVNSTGVFEIAQDGNLLVSDTSGKTYWSSGLEASSNLSTERTVRLMDTGDLVLLNDRLKMKLWKSFDHPTDTFLPGMKMNVALELSCWRSPQDPGRGNFTFKRPQTKDNRYVILNHTQLYWESESEIQGDLMKSEDDMTVKIYQLLNYNITGSFYNKRLFINSTGYLQFLLRDNQQDILLWWQPKSLCLIYNYCGYFATCNDDNNEVTCNCLPGFYSPLKGKRDLRCARTTESCGEDSTTFLNLVMVKIGIPDEKVVVGNEAECRSECLKNCLGCQAYSYKTPTILPNDSTCWIWTQKLSIMKEEYHGGYGRNIAVRVHKSDIEPTPKTCEPCGTNIVPYPLSTGLHCGDSIYYNFICNNLTLQLSFFPTISTENYVVTSIEPEFRNFSIRINVSRCSPQFRDNNNPIIYPPFNATSNSQCPDRIEVSWQPPPEPTCAKSTDCHGWNHSTCKGDRCLCDASYQWRDDLLACSQEVITPPNSTMEKPTGKRSSKSSLPLILGTTLAGVVTLACIIVFAFVCGGKIALKLRQDKESIRRKRGRFYDSERHVKDLIDMEVLEEKDNEGIEVPYFDFESILEATNHFSEANKLGKGGYGQVYKGKLQGGEDIAVKRLSSVSSQGLQEFKNEVVLIAKLQHRNLVRLRGYCIKGEEKILLYEYMPNKSLDSFIFDPTKSVLLDWPMRFDIILGVSRGMLYLHQDSRLRVIHRDLKASNILLDGEMQPKISDFGLARIFASKETEASTQRVVGTYGYMSPEYALDGHFSTKSDVFSFGVLLLEIISGKKNTGFYQSNESSSLLGYAWKLWTQNKMVDLMDLSLGETCNANQFIRCAHIGLLCVQDEPDHRPNMSNIVIMLDSETASLPTPKQPTFFMRRDLSSTASSSQQFESSIQEGR